MNVIGVDPGDRSPAHVAIDEDGKARLFSPVPFRTESDAIVFFEAQHPGKTSGKKSLLTLAFAAGLHVGSYLRDGHACYRLPVAQNDGHAIGDIVSWRELVLPRSARLPKNVFHDRLDTPEQISKAGPDFVDAYWIARAGLVLLRKGVKLKAIEWHK